MKIKQDIRSVTYLKNRAADLLAQINETRRPVIITQNGEPRAVLQDPESYERMRAAVAMLRLLADSEQARRAGKVVAQDTVFSSLRRKLKQRDRTHVG